MDNTNDNPCSICEHAYGDHYVTFNRAHSGCDAETDQPYGCHCDGYYYAEGE